jgi:hypothetical protein
MIFLQTHPLITGATRCFHTLFAQHVSTLNCSCALLLEIINSLNMYFVPNALVVVPRGQVIHSAYVDSDGLFTRKKISFVRQKAIFVYTHLKIII